MDDLITIGEIIRHQGNKGEVRVRALTDFPDRFEDLDWIYLIKNRIKKEVEIEKVRYHKGFIILKFIGVDDIGQAIEHKGYLVKIPKTEMVELPEDNYYIDQITGLEVYTEENEYLGVVTDILETGANDVYIIKDGNKELLIPAIKQVITDVNLADNKMFVKLLPGLR